MTTREPSPWWRSRAVWLALALHVVYLGGLCQLQLSDAELARVLGPGDQPRTVSGVLDRGGLTGTLALYFGVHEPVQLYHRYAESLLRGRDLRRPVDDPQQGSFSAYRDVPIEYQPGKLLLMVPPALFSPRYEIYLPLFVLWSGFLYLAAVIGAWRLAGDGSAAQAKRVLGWSLAMLVLFGPYVSSHLDQGVALTCVAGWALFRRGWQRRTPAPFAAFGAVAAAGVMIKVAPGVLLPAAGIALLCVAPQPRWRDALLVGLGFVLTLAALHGICVQLWGQGYLASYAFHLDRGVQIESTWAGVLAAGRGVFGPLSAEYNFGSYHLVTPYTALIRLLFPLTLMALTAVTAWRAWQVRGKAPDDPLPVLTLGLLLALVLTSKVFSFNYLLWITPLVPALAARTGRWLPVASLYATALGLTQLYRVYDYAYAKITMPWEAVLLLNLRNLALMALLAWLLWRLPHLLAPALAQTKAPGHRSAR